MKNMNKKGMGAIATIFIGFLVLLIVLAGIFAVANVFGGTDGTSSKDCADSTGTLTLTAIDALQEGTTISAPTITCGVDGQSVTTSVTSGTTTFGIGRKLDCLVSKANYIDIEYETTMECGGVSDSVKMYSSTSDNPAFTIKDLDSSTTALTDNVAGGAVNTSNPSAGDVLNLVVEFQGTALESSGEGIYVIEFPAKSNSNITAGDTGVTLGSLAHTTVPTVHSLQNAGSRVDAFEVPAVVGSAIAKYDLLISLQASSDLTGGVYTDWYAKQAFVETDGTIVVGVENSLGTAKYENTIDRDFWIT